MWSSNKRVFDEVPADHPAWDAIACLLRDRSSEYESHYNRRLRLKKLWRVRPSDVHARHADESAWLGQPTQLFHGTGAEAARAIAKEGFQLPSTAGMFGRGLYFADCPLKSAQYSQEVSDPIAFAWKLATQGLSAARKTTKGQMLLCDVYLGKPLKLSRANNTLRSPEDLRGGMLDKLLGRKYDSVFAPADRNRFFHAVRVPEYVVYRESQAVPQYLIEFEYEHLK